MKEKEPNNPDYLLTFKVAFLLLLSLRKKTKDDPRFRDLVDTYRSYGLGGIVRFLDSVRERGSTDDPETVEPSEAGVEEN